MDRLAPLPAWCDDPGMRSLPRNLKLSLLAVQAVAAATLFRSLLLERWTTVVFAIVLIASARAALRGRTWGVGGILTAATAFPGAALLGFAPQWFWVVGLIGVLPFALALRPMARFDAAATAMFAFLAGGTAVLCTFAWREAAYAIFYAFYAH
jgi:hypothetical protein